MNYVNTLQEGQHQLIINTRVDQSAVVVWYLNAEGSDSRYSWQTDGDGVSFYDGSYYQTLLIPVENYEFRSETFYELKGVSNGVDVYRGRIFATDQILSSYKATNGAYEENNEDKDYIVL